MEILNQLNTHDKVAITVFGSNITSIMPLEMAPTTDMTRASIKTKLLEIQPDGSESFEKAYKSAASELEKIAKSSDPDKVENRIILITDDIPAGSGANKQSMMVRILGVI
jgi:hypothetical protein